ncbi:MAG: hypothetical protein ACI9RU_000055 [Litorivivens sp.]|jgi:hypothetical protein
MITLLCLCSNLSLLSENKNLTKPLNPFERNTAIAIDSSMALSEFFPTSDGGDAPVAENYSVSVCEDTATDISPVEGVDISDDQDDLVGLTIVIDPEHGVLSGLPGLNLTYTPDPNFHGDDVITYFVTDGEELESSTATITITVLPQNDVPTANSGLTLDVTILDNLELVNFDLADIASLDLEDIEGDAMDVTIISVTPSNDITMNATDTDISVTAAPGSCGEVSVVLVICNDAGNLEAHDASCNPLTLCSEQITVVLNILPADADGDGLPMYAEPAGDGDASSDADSDGIPDAVEILPLEDDSDPCALEFANTDGAGVADYLDTDSDNDGILDEDEGVEDPDGDGIPNYRDTDSDNDGISDLIEGGVNNSDDDDFPNYLDADSDNDGIDDGIEDANQDGVWDCADGETNWMASDTDADGILDGLEIVTNPLDIDSDDDGLADGPGANDEYVGFCEDCDADGIVDSNETSPTNPDTDGDCLLDGVEVGLTQAIEPNGCIDGTDQSMTYTCESCCGDNINGLTFQLDADDSTTTNPLDADSDDDDFSDGHEDAGLDGLFDEGNLPEPFLTLASLCYEEECVGTNCFGGFDSNPNSLCSPECWAHDECDCDGQADTSQDSTPNGANYCADLWNALCAIPDLNNETLLDYVTIGNCDEFTIDGEFPSISSILDNNSINDPGLTDDGDQIPQSCDNCNPGYYLAYNNNNPCPSGSYIGSGATANAFQSDDDGDGIGDLCDDCPNDDGGLKGCKSEDACNYNPFAACENIGECEYSFPETSGSFDDMIYACSSDVTFDLLAAIVNEYGFGSMPDWGSAQEITVLIDDVSYSWEDLGSLDLSNIGQNWCDGVDVMIDITHTDLDVIYCDYDDVFETVTCDVCGVSSSLNFELFVNYQAQGVSTGMTVCFGVEALDTPIPNPFNSFPNCNSLEDYNWTWSTSSGNADINSPNSLLDPLFELSSGLAVDDQVEFTCTSEILGCPTAQETFTVTISNSSELEFSLEDELTPVTLVNICANASEQEFHFEILSIGGGMWEPDDSDLQEWSSISIPAVSSIGGGVYAIDIVDLFAEGGTNQVILYLNPDGGCPDNSDTINFVFTEAPVVDFVSTDLVGDSLLVLCETAENRTFELTWEGPVTWDIIDSVLNENLSLSIIDGANSADIEVDSPSAPGSYIIETSTLIEPVIYGCSNISDSFELLVTESPTITNNWIGLDESFYCAPDVLNLDESYFSIDPNSIWSSGEQTITASGFDASFVNPSPVDNLEEINFNSSSDDFMPLQEDIELTISIDDGNAPRSCQAVEQSLVIHAGAAPVVDYLELVSLNTPFDGMEVTGVELNSDILCQGSDFTVQAHPDLQVIGSETAMSNGEVGNWSVQGVDETTGGTLLQVGDISTNVLAVSMTYSWQYFVNGIDHTCFSALEDETWTIEADTTCTGCPIFELPGPAFVACATDLAENPNDEGGYIRWGYFDENGLIGGFFDDGLEQQTTFYPTLNEIEMYGDDSNRLFALVSAYEDLHCGCLSLGENTVFTDVEELIIEGIEIFPNPSTGLFQIKMPEELLFVPLRFQVFDSMGKTVVDGLDCALGSCMLDLSNEADGVYIVRIINNATHAAHKKFIVKQ